MALTPSTMLPLGTPIPEFRLKTPEGQEFSHKSFADAKGLLVIFMCNHCPYVIHLKEQLASITKAYLQKGIATLAINSNDWEKYPDDSPEKMQEEAQEFGYVFPYLVDEDQTVAHKFQAACTPEFYLFQSSEGDAGRELVYRGQFDDSRPGNQNPVTGEDLTAAMESLLSGKPVAEDQKPSVGCNIKWKPGNEPTYFKPKV